jgi:phage recombination protein Bet
MNSQLSVASQNQVSFSKEQIDVIKNQIAVGATDSELKSFIWQCERTGLDPFSRQIYFIKSAGKVQIQTSIDGFRVIAERSGEYEGQTQAMWCGHDGVWKEIWTDNDFPVAAKIGVYKKGFREPLYAIAHWNEYFAQPGFMHKKMPALMLAKVAESLALRKAFPNLMSGLYTKEELVTEEPKSRIHVDQPTDAEVLEAKAVNGYTIPFGKFKMRSLEEVGPNELGGYVDYIEKKAAKEGKPIQGQVKEFIDRACEFIASFENDPTAFKSTEQDVPF